MAKLYELSNSYIKFNTMVEDALDNMEDITEDDLQMFVDTLDSIKDSIEGKCENIVKFMKNIDGDIEAFKKEEQRLNKRRKYLERKHDGLKGYMESTLRAANIKEVKAGSFKVKFQKSPASVEVINEKHVPEEFKSYEVKVAKKEIMALLKDGKQVPGVVLVNDKDHMRIS